MKMTMMTLCLVLVTFFVMLPRFAESFLSSRSILAANSPLLRGNVLSPSLKRFPSCTMTSLSHGIAAQYPLQRRLDPSAITHKIKNFLWNSAKIILPIIALLLLYGVMPAFAKEAVKSKLVNAKAAASTKKVSIWKKILEGANVSAPLKNWKAGDTRTQFSALINASSNLTILTGLFGLGYLFHKKREITQTRAMKREFLRVQEYKENMYFDAVEEILNKLDDPQIKSTAKSRLQKDLKELDPNGLIQKFVKEGGARPDISDLLGLKKKKSQPLRKNPSNKATRQNKKIDSDSVKDDEEKSPVKRGDIISSKKSSDSTSEVLDALYESLAGDMPDKLRKKLVDYLRFRIESIDEPSKKEAALEKVAKKLGDNEYWIEYSTQFNS